MPDAYVINTNIAASDKTALDSLLKNSGFNSIHGHASVLTAITAKVDIAIVMMPVDPAETAAVLAAVKTLAAAGVRVIGIWKQNAAGEKLPVYMKNYGYAAVCISSVDADQALKGNKPKWENSDCREREIQDIPRNGC